MNRLFILTQVVFFFSQSLFAQSTIDSALTVANESKVIEVDNSYRKGNYEALLKSIGEKRIVCLGEFNHGCGEIFASRIDIIRQLHDHLGFNTILFESGLGEVGVIDIKKDELTENQLVNGFFGPWRTAEFQELVAYARSENLDIAGFDVQRTGTTFTAFLSEKQSEFKDIEEEFVVVKRLLGNHRAVYDSVKDRTNELIDTYNKLAESWEGDEFVQKVLLDRTEFLRYKLEFTKTRDYTERWKARDVAMANNVKWLLGQLDDSEKVIIVGHNFHIARYNEKETVMGEILHEQYGDDMFVLGVFAATGTFHNNARKPETLQEPDSLQLDIKHIIQKDPGKLTLLDLNGLSSAASVIMNGPIIVNDTFIDLYSSNSMNLMKSFDALLLFDEVSPPEELN